MNKKIVVIGGGPAGVEAALAEQQTGTNVTIISDGPIGGRAGWHSLLPSKVWLSAADAISMISGTTATSDEQISPDLSPAGVVQRIRLVKQNWTQRMETALENKGVDIIKGTASFIDDNKVEVRDIKERKLNKTTKLFPYRSSQLTMQFRILFNRQP